jgi:hypothetical protein
MFYTAVAKSRAQHIIRLGLDGKNFQLLFTWKPIGQTDEVNYLRPLLTIDRINHHLHFYNGVDKVFILDMQGAILHVQHQTGDHFHSFQVFNGKSFLSNPDVLLLDGEDRFR